MTSRVLSTSSCCSATLVFAAVLISGCGANTPITLSDPPSSPANLTGNWEVTFQNATPSPAVAMTGALQGGASSQVTGTFANQRVACSPAIDDFTGSIDANGNLNLSAPYVQLQLTIPTDFSGTATGTLGGGGYLCLAIMGPTPVTATEITSVSGTYSGTLADSASPGLGGTATLILTQSATPNSSGQFPVSGTVMFPSASGFGTAPLGGTISGTGISLSDSSTVPNSPSINLTASTNPGASQITISDVTYSSGSLPSTSFSGTLTRQ
jgi:hypothetical protein